MKEINGKEHESNHVSSADARVRHLCGSVKAINADTNTPVRSYIYTYTDTHGIHDSDKTDLYTRDSLVSS